jgi:hypothetical protein
MDGHLAHFCGILYSAKYKINLQYSFILLSNLHHIHTASLSELDFSNLVVNKILKDT